VQRFHNELALKGERLSNVVLMGMGEPLANYHKGASTMRERATKRERERERDSPREKRSEPKSENESGLAEFPGMVFLVHRSCCWIGIGGSIS
jgi:hypothetical protein